MTKPTLVDVRQTVFNTTGLTKTFTVDFQAGDVISVIALAEDGSSSFSAPTATGLTFVLRAAQNASASLCASMGAQAHASAAGSSVVITVTISSTTPRWGAVLWIHRNSAGMGGVAEQHTTTKVVSFTPATLKSWVMWAIGDFNVEAIHRIVPPYDNPVVLQQLTLEVSVHVVDGVNYAGGATNYGIADGGVTGPYSIIVLEAKATAAEDDPTVTKTTPLLIPTQRIG